MTLGNLEIAKTSNEGRGSIKHFHPLALAQFASLNSVQRLSPKKGESDKNSPPGTTHGLFKAKPSIHHVHSTLRMLRMITIGCHTPAPRPSSLSCQKAALCKVRVVFSKPVHAVRVWRGPPGTNHGLFKAKPSSHHVHSTLRMIPPTSPCPTISADAEPACKRAATIFCAVRSVV